MLSGADYHKGAPVRARWNGAGRGAATGRVYISASPNYDPSQQLTLKIGVARPSDVREKKPA